MFDGEKAMKRQAFGTGAILALAALLAFACADEGSTQAGPCLTNDDCPDFYFCNPVIGKCIFSGRECEESGECPDGYMCSSGACVPDGGDDPVYVMPDEDPEESAPPADLDESQNDGPAENEREDRADSEEVQEREKEMEIEELDDPWECTRHADCPNFPDAYCDRDQHICIDYIPDGDTEEEEDEPYPGDPDPEEIELDVAELEPEADPDLSEIVEESPELDEEEEVSSGCPLLPAGKCVGNINFWCEGDETMQENCDDSERICGMADDGRYRCLGQRGDDCDDVENFCIPGLDCEDGLCGGTERDCQSLTSVGTQTISGSTIGELAVVDQSSCLATATPGTEKVYRIDLESHQGVFARLEPSAGASASLYLLEDCNDGTTCPAAVEIVEGDTPELRYSPGVSGTYYLVADSTGVEGYTFDLTVDIGHRKCISAELLAHQDVRFSDRTSGEDFNPGSSGCDEGTGGRTPGDDAVYRFKVGPNQIVDVTLEATGFADVVLMLREDCQNDTHCVGRDVFVGSDSTDREYETIRIESTSDVDQYYYAVLDTSNSFDFGYYFELDYDPSSGCDQAQTADVTRQNPWTYEGLAAYAALLLLWVLGRLVLRRFRKQNG